MACIQQNLSGIFQIRPLAVALGVRSRGPCAWCARGNGMLGLGGIEVAPARNRQLYVFGSVTLRKIFAKMNRTKAFVNLCENLSCSRQMIEEPACAGRYWPLFSWEL